MNNLSSTELKKLIHDCQIDGNHRLANTLSELLALREAGKEPVAVVELNDYISAAEALGEVPRRKAVKELYDGALVVGQQLYAAPQLPAVPDGWIPLDEQSPYDAPYKIPADIRELIAEEIGILFSEEDAQAMWNICRAAMIAAAPKPEVK